MEQNQEQLKKEAAAMKCDGNCVEDYGNHAGAVIPVVITADWLTTPVEFNYCQQAIEEDRRRGFTVTPENEQGARAERAAKEKEQIEPVGYLMDGCFYYPGAIMLNGTATPLYSHPQTSAPVPSLDRDKLIDFDELRELMQTAVDDIAKPTEASIIYRCARVALQHFNR